MYVTVQNAKIYVMDEGSGTPTLFLHGVADSSDVWSGVIARLKKHYRCLAPDLPGFGRSTAPEDFDCSFPVSFPRGNGSSNYVVVRRP